MDARVFQIGDEVVVLQANRLPRLIEHGRGVIHRVAETQGDWAVYNIYFVTGFPMARSAAVLRLATEFDSDTKETR